jgi:hypothetical protein
MGQLIDLIRTHAVHLQLQSLALAIDEAACGLSLNAEACFCVQRLRSVLAFCGNQIAGADPFFIEVRVFNSINARLSVALAEVLTLLDDGNLEHITRAKRLVDDVLIQLVEVPGALASEVSVSPEDMGALRLEYPKTSTHPSSPGGSASLAEPGCAGAEIAVRRRDEGLGKSRATVL